MSYYYLSCQEREDFSGGKIPSFGAPSRRTLTFLIDRRGLGSSIHSASSLVVKYTLFSGPAVRFCIRFQVPVLGAILSTFTVFRVGKRVD